MSNLSDFLNKKLSDPIITLAGTEGTAGQVPISQGPGLPPAWGAAGVIADYQEFITSGTWTKPAGATWVYVEAIGGGGGGGTSHLTGRQSGGGGGGFTAMLLRASECASTETVTVGAGGLGSTASQGPGQNGGDSSFGSLVTANGGGAGQGVAGAVGGKGGGGEFGAGSGVSGDFWPACGGYSSGGGGVGISPIPLITDGGSCVMGGAGGGGHTGAGGISQYGGNGGDGGDGVAGGNGSSPGGGGGASYNTTQAGNGAAGRVRVWCW